MRKLAFGMLVAAFGALAAQGPALAQWPASSSSWQTYNGNINDCVTRADNAVHQAAGFKASTTPAAATKFRSTAISTNTPPKCAASSVKTSSSSSPSARTLTRRQSTEKQILESSSGQPRSARGGEAAVAMMDARARLGLLPRPADAAAVEWRVSGTPRALRAGRRDHAGARRGDRRRRRAGTGLAAGAPAALHRRHQRQAGRTDRGALSRIRERPRRADDLSRARPAGGLRDARPEAARAGRAPFRRHAGGMDHPHALPLSTCAASGATTASASGCAGPTRAKAARTRSPPSASASRNG